MRGDRWIMWQTRALFDNAAGFGFQSNGTDITELKRLQERAAELYEAAQKEIAQRQHVEVELRRSNEELAQFAFAISHDLRSPLSALRASPGNWKRNITPSWDPMPIRTSPISRARASA